MIVFFVISYFVVFLSDFVVACQGFSIKFMQRESEERIKQTEKMSVKVTKKTDNQRPASNLPETCSNHASGGLSSSHIQLVSHIC